MKEKKFTRERSFADFSICSTSKVEVLSLAEQRRLISGSYCHQYGVLIRLALFTGLTASELLGLQWEDLDIDNFGLRIIHTFTTGYDGSGLHIMHSPSRFVPLPTLMFKELAEWYEDQNNTLAMYNLFAHCNSVAATLKGYQMPLWLLEYFFRQILEFCSLPDCSLHTLRDTFAVNSLAGGMDIKTLCAILGEPNVPNIYAKYIPDRQNTCGTNKEGEPNGQILTPTEIVYPVNAAKLANGLT